jgi:uncharacterized protein YndB with AHSA1/START domain
MPADVAPTEVTRRIAAPAARIFEVLRDPRRHPDFDGSAHFTERSQMLKAATSSDLIGGVGDIFAMTMFLDDVGTYTMVNYVVEYEVNRRLGWEPAPGDDAAVGGDERFAIGVPSGQRWSFRLTPDGEDATVVTEIYDGGSLPQDVREATDEGRGWIDTMTATLERLDAICAD